MNFSNLTPLEIQDLINSYRSELRKLEFQVQHTAGLLQQLETALAKADTVLVNTPTVTSAPAQAEAKPRRGRGRAKQAGEQAAPKTKPAGRRGRPRKAKPETAAKEAPQATAEVTAEPQAKAKAPRGPKKAGKAPKAAAKAKKETAAKKEPKAKAEGKKAPGRQERLSPIDNLVIESLKGQQKALITSEFVDIIKQNPSIKSGEAQVKVKLNRSVHKLANKKGMLVKVEYPGRGYAYALNEWVNNKGELPKKYAH